MSYVAQRDRIVTQIRTVAKVGLVHANPPYGDAYTRWVTAIDGLDQIRAWEVGQAEDSPTIRYQQSIRHRYFPWVIWGKVGLVNATAESDADYAAAAEASYETLINLRESIRDVLDLDPTLGGTCLDTSTHTVGSPPEPVTIGGGFLCWWTQIRFTTYEVLTG